MKTLAQTLLIGGGVIGALIAIPFAVFIWMMRGALSPDEQSVLVLYCFVLPGLCIGAVVAGIMWKKEKATDTSEESDAPKDVT
jgi:hypothetical protein